MRDDSGRTKEGAAESVDGPRRGRRWCGAANCGAGGGDAVEETRPLGLNPFNLERPMS
uniref:Uncharacterized protein n=1 Tax=Arundo donax TaxID=35708 RepID=A0A0A8Y4P5_ARUDO